MAKLIFDSAPNSLPIIFNINSELSTAHFLQQSLSKTDGQYGFGNHWVMEADNQVVGCTSAWHDKLSSAFLKATLNSITNFYGPLNAITVLRNANVLNDCIPKPKSNEWCIGHFSILEEYKRQGIGTLLLKKMEQKAIKAGKSTLSLDTESSNKAAISFYTQYGFEVEQESTVTERMQILGIHSHLHMVKSVIQI